MASLELQKGWYRIVFRYDGKKYQRARMARLSASHISEASCVNPDFIAVQVFIPSHEGACFFSSVRRLSACPCRGPRTFHATPRTFRPAVAFCFRLE
jgi:hypothetical protein